MVGFGSAKYEEGRARLCVAYSALNHKMNADRWPVPKIQEIFDELEGGRDFTMLDLFSGYLLAGKARRRLEVEYRSFLSLWNLPV